MYEKERTKILAVIGDKIVAIEHIGSTAIPNLRAKPIIDIMVGVSDIAKADECIEPLQGIGYEYVPEYEVSVSERAFSVRIPQASIYISLSEQAISGSDISCFGISCTLIPRQLDGTNN